jgi:hypothetical protein
MATTTSRPGPLQDWFQREIAMVRWIIVGLLAASTPAFGEDFEGYPCTVDCSGHEAGYAWAEENAITDPDDCSGKSRSFVEGCRAYADEHGDGEYSGDDEDETEDETEDDDEDAEGT